MERNSDQSTGKVFTRMLGISFNSTNLFSWPRLVIVLLLVMMTLLDTGAAAAQKAEPEPEIKVFEVSQQDLNGDGRLDLAIINCSFITDHDQVIVFDTGRDMVLSDDWQQATDFENDVWIFDAAADGQIELIIEFRMRQEDLLATLWDDQNGDGTVSYQQPPSFKVTESKTPTLKVFGLDGWWIRDGKTNFNLDLTVDGQVQSSFTAKHWLHRVETDGTPDFLIKVRDLDHDGRPDYQWVNAWPKAPAGEGIRRTEIAVSPNDDEPPIKGSIFWPFLGSTRDWDNLRTERPARIPPAQIDIVQERSGYNKTYGISMPPIQMLWDKGSLLYVGEFVASRFNDSNWFVYSIKRASPDKVALVTFEAPFAFYDLGADDDGYPELAIRFEQYHARDLFPFRRTNPEPVQVIRYTWDQDNDTTWDYKVGLIGRHTITDTVTVHDLTLQIVPPETLPDWVVDHTWDGATFVASEGDEFWTSEGIYEWAPSETWRDNYITGISDVRPTVHDLSYLDVGLRGEYVFDLHHQPTLYFSPVDRKLHLLYAEGGEWKIDETLKIEYRNLGGDYINQWTLLENGVPIKEIYYLSNSLIYADRSSIQFMKIDQPPALFTTVPPTTNDERLELGERLQPFQTDISPYDFEALFAQFGGPIARVEGASLRDLRVLDNGFRFVMELGPEHWSEGMGAMEDQKLASGAYVVTYNGSFSMEPLTPADIGLSVRLPAVNAITVGDPVKFQTEITNGGLADAKDLLLVVEAQQGSTTVELARQNIDVLSGIPTRIAVEWVPPSAGEWKYQARLAESENGASIADIEYPIDVTGSRANPSRVVLLSVGGEVQAILLSITLLAFLAATARMLWLALAALEKKRLEQDRGR